MQAKRVRMLVGVILAASLASCQRATTPAAGPPTSAAPGSDVVGELGRGTVTGHTYKNDYFNLTVELPESWYVQSQDEMAELQKIGNQVATGQGANPQLKEAMDSAQTRTLTLVTAFELPPGTPGRFNPSFLVLAERVKHLPGIKSGAEYCQQLQNSLNMTAMKYQFDPVEGGHKIGSLNAHCLPVHRNFMGIDIYQRYYAARHKDYVLSIIITYSNDEERKLGEGILATVKAGP